VELDALVFQDSSDFDRLALAISDEQATASGFTSRMGFNVTKA